MTNINMTIEEYDLIINEKNQIIENLSKKLDLYKDKLNLIDKFLKKSKIEDYESFFIIIEKYINSIEYCDRYIEDTEDMNDSDNEEWIYCSKCGRFKFNDSIKFIYTKIDNKTIYYCFNCYSMVEDKIEEIDINNSNIDYEICKHEDKGVINSVTLKNKFYDNVNEDIEESKVETEIETPILSCIDKNSEPIVSIKLDETKDKIFNNLLNQYYNYEKRFFSKCIDNIYINENIDEINKYINKKHISNANIIYNMSIIYNKYLHDNEKGLVFEKFIEYNKDNYEFIEISNTRIKDKYKRCYNILSDVLHLDKNTIIIILSRFNLSYSKIYKLHDKHRENLKIFIFEELNKCDFSNISCKNRIFNNNHVNTDLIKKLTEEIPFCYIGNKKSMIEHLLNIINQIDEPINKFVDLFSGSLVLPYIIRNIKPNIKIKCYENNPYLIRFYKYISENVENFILEINNKIEIINNEKNIDLYLKGILKEIDTFNDSIQGLWYFVITNISHCNMISYKTNGISSVTFNKKEFCRFTKKCQDGTLFNKLRNFSNFIKTIEINNVNIIENYTKIKNVIDKNTLLYIDSPYYGRNSNKLYYTNFNLSDHIELNKFVNNISNNNILFILSNSDTIFINNLYNNFNINKYEIKSNINTKIRKELIITNFKYIL
jgi:hypothetical protein